MYVCMHACMYVRTYVCMYVRMYVRTYVCMRKIHIDPHQTDQEYSTNLHRTVYQYSWWLTSPSRLFYGRSFTSRFTHHQPVIIQTEPCPPGPNQLGWASPMCHRSRNTSAGSLRSKKFNSVSSLELPKIHPKLMSSKCPGFQLFYLFEACYDSRPIIPTGRNNRGVILLVVYPIVHHISILKKIWLLCTVYSIYIYINMY